MDDPETILPEQLKQFGRKWVNNPCNLVLYGQAGRGKTWFMHCLMHDLFFQRKWIRFFKSKTLDDLIIENMKTYGSAQFLIQKQICDCEFLFLDDIGMERSTDRLERDFFEIIDTRLCTLLPTIISTNLDADKIEESYGSRINSRLKEYQWIKFSGDDLRGRNEIIF